MFEIEAETFKNNIL